MVISCDQAALDRERTNGYALGQALKKDPIKVMIVVASRCS
jgi:hypothetical protein